MFSFLALSLWIAPILLFASVITAQTASANPVLEAAPKVQSDTQLAQLQTENNLVSETPTEKHLPFISVPSPKIMTASKN